MPLRKTTSEQLDELDRRSREALDEADNRFVEFPALWTGYDEATGRCSWHEQHFNTTTGLRQTRENGRSGGWSVTNNRWENPAYPVGNGTLPPSEFTNAASGSAEGGIEVWMRFRANVPSLGNVYEFDWGGGGAGGGFFIRLEQEGLGGTDQEGIYAWTEMEEDGAGGFQVKSNGRTGTIGSNPARDDSGKSAVPLGLTVYAKQGVSQSGSNVDNQLRFTTPDLDAVILITELPPSQGGSNAGSAGRSCGSGSAQIDISNDLALGVVTKYNPAQDRWFAKEAVYVKEINGHDLQLGRYLGHLQGIIDCDQKIGVYGVMCGCPDGNGGGGGGDGGGSTGSVDESEADDRTPNIPVVADCSTCEFDTVPDTLLWTSDSGSCTLTRTVIDGINHWRGSFALGPFCSGGITVEVGVVCYPTSVAANADTFLCTEGCAGSLAGSDCPYCDAGWYCYQGCVGSYTTVNPLKCDDVVCDPFTLTWPLSGNQQGCGICLTQSNVVVTLPP